MIRSKIIFLLLTVSVFSCNREDPNPLADANFFVDNAGCKSPCTVHFYDQSLNAVKWKYDFGNDSISENKNDSTTYLEKGSYCVKLIVWNAEDIVDSISKSISVK